VVRVVANFAHEPAGGGERRSSLREERPEDVKDVCLGRKQLKASIDSMVNGVSDDCFGLGTCSIIRAALHQEGREAGEVGTQWTDQGVVDWMPGKVRIGGLRELLDRVRWRVARCEQAAREVCAGREEHDTGRHREAGIACPLQQCDSQPSRGGVCGDDDAAVAVTLEEPLVASDRVIERAGKGCSGASR
jgi:hypothetical protein